MTRAELDDAVGSEVARTRLPIGSSGRGMSVDWSSASVGRGRGSGLAVSVATGATLGGAGAGKLVTVEANIGAGWRPACRNNALTMIAVTATTAAVIAIASRGLRMNRRNSNPSNRPRSILRWPRRAGRLRSSSMAIALGTLLHLEFGFLGTRRTECHHGRTARP